MRQSKGSKFEREICKTLSLWWTGGKRDDVFWRSQTSGGRATRRMRKGKTTYGSYGDIAAVDPIGEPLLKLFTIELKRGSSLGCAGDLIDAPTSDCASRFEKAIKQAVDGQRAAGSKGWMLLCRRDYKLAIAYMDWSTIKQFPEVLGCPCVRFHLPISLGKKRVDMRFVSVPFDLLLSRLAPQRVVAHRLP